MATEVVTASILELTSALEITSTEVGATYPTYPLRIITKVMRVRPTINTISAALAHVTAFAALMTLRRSPLYCHMDPEAPGGRLSCAPSRRVHSTANNLPCKSSNMSYTGQRRLLHLDLFNSNTHRVVHMEWQP